MKCRQGQVLSQLLGTMHKVSRAEGEQGPRLLPSKGRKDARDAVRAICQRRPQPVHVLPRDDELPGVDEQRVKLQIVLN